MMDPNHRDPKADASIVVRGFRRAVRASWRHRRYIILGIATGLIHAALHTVSLIGMLPVLKLLLEDEGLHGWVDRAVAGHRLDVEFEPYLYESAPKGARQARLLKISSHSELSKQKVDKDAIIAELNGNEISASDLFTYLAAAPAGEEVRLRASRGVSSWNVTVALEKPGLEWRIALWAASWIPREDSRSDRFGLLVYVLMGLIVVVVIANVARFIADYYISIGVQRTMMDLRLKLYNKVLRLPMAFFSQQISDTVSQFVQDVQEVQRGLKSLFGKMVREPFKVIFTLMWAVWLDYRVTLIMLITGPIGAFLFWRIGASLKRNAKRLLKQYGIMIGALQNSLSGVAMVKVFTQEQTERKRLFKIDRQVFKRHMKLQMLEAATSPLLEVLGIVTLSVLTAWLGSRVIERDLTPSEFVNLVIVFGALIDPFRKMADVYSRVARSGAGADRIFQTLDAKTESELDHGREELSPLAKSIEFRDVLFAYPGTERAALDGVTLTVNCGEIVAVVGRNGSGKTTLVNMIPRFYDPDGGVILFDGVDIRDATLRSLRKQIGYVPQDSTIFPLTIAENIAYGKPKASLEEIEAAARRAYAESFILEKPAGFDTVVGEGGRTLSGGQRQRLAIARAILREPHILIFDEATSQVDAESEGLIQKAIQEFSKGRTTFIIAHRLSTIRFADRIIVMDAGKVLDSGAHDELYERCGLYRGLCETQLIE